MPMAFAPIAKLKKFTDEENNTQTWINDVVKAITANNRDDARTMQPQIVYQPQQLIQTPPQNPATITSGNPRSRITQNWRSTIVVHQLISNSTNQPSGSCQWSSGTKYNQNLSSQNYLSLLVTPEDAVFSKQETNQKPLTHNILLAASTKDKLLAAIFSFELEEITLVLLFNRAALNIKPITMMYTNAKVNGQYIKLILDSESAGSIITKQLMDQLGYRVDRAASARIITANGATKTPIGEIDNFPFEVNGIIVSIKVLVMEATQYQALVGNDWLIKVNAILDWTMQEL
ncbi:hypothetical protein G9A89_004526 [Geosiphon pyriformis]|nr:hypothetical protein G9A89_004526 [Geosiphon pyriformis]